MSAMAAAEIVTRVEDLVASARRLVTQQREHDSSATRKVLEGVDLFEVHMVDRDEFERIFWLGFNTELNRLGSSHQRPEPIHVRVAHAPQEPVTPLSVKVVVRSFVDAQYSVSSGNLFVREMGKEELEEIRDRCQAQANGHLRIARAAKAALKALDENGVATVGDLPEAAQAALDEIVNGSRR